MATDTKQNSLHNDTKVNSLHQDVEVSSDDDSVTQRRETWVHKADFILSCLGFCVGIGNVWRFPYLCYKNGGGVFFIPYLVFMLFGGIPISVMEVATAQFMSKGSMEMWRLCPLFKGIGYATTILVFFLNVYYIIVLTWDLLFLFFSFNSVLPWSHCNNWWNSDRCRLVNDRTMSANESISNWTQSSSNWTQPSGNWTTPSSIWTTAGKFSNISSNSSSLSSLGLKSSNVSFVDPAVEFWENRILQKSSGIDEPGGVVWELALCLLLAWLLVYVCIWKGVKSTGKVVYFTATFPYVILTILIIRGLTLPGSAEGIIFYLKPDLSKLGSAQVWLDAGTQIFFSYAIGLGTMAALGSYNKFKYNCYRDCIVICLLNSCTSVYAGFAIFSVLGFMAHEQGADIKDVAVAGPGLVFIAYPKAITQMPLSTVWAVLFFFMIVTVALDSQFVGVESFVVVFMDLVPEMRKYYRRQKFVAVYCAVSFLVGLCMVTRGGIYVFQIFDYYSASGMALMWVCFTECITIGWFYGANRFYDNFEMMIGYRLSQWMKLCWTVFTPVITAVVLVWMWCTFELLTYNRTYIYPAWAQGLGLCFAFSSMICIPLYALLFFLQAPGKSFQEKWKHSITPVLLPERIPLHWPDRTELVKFYKSVTHNDQHRPWCRRSSTSQQIMMDGECDHDS